MPTEYVFYAVFLSQILLISYFLPRRVLERVEYVVNNYPPERYPRLYPVSLARAERAQSFYRLANMAVLVVGLALLAQGIWAGGEEMLAWDTNTAIFLYYMLQYSPLMIATTAGFTYFNLRRKPDTRSTRTAELRRRRLVDYVSPVWLGTAATPLGREAAFTEGRDPRVPVYVAFVGFVVYFETLGFPWFGGYLNIVFITAMNALFAVLVWRLVYGKQKDPYMTAPDRARMIEVAATSLVFISIAATIYTVLSIALGALEMRSLSPVAMSVYLQLISAAAFRSMRIDDVNFEVYREDRVAA